MDDIESFRLLLADPRNAALKQRWDAFTEHAVARAASKNIPLTAAELVTLPSVRIYCISGQWPTADEHAWEDQAKSLLPAWRAAAENAALYESLNDVENPQHGPATERWASLSPQERMRRAREAGMELPKTAERAHLSDEERSRLQKQLNSGMLRGSAKIAAYRRLEGLT